MCRENVAEKNPEKNLLFQKVDFFWIALSLVACTNNLHIVFSNCQNCATNGMGLCHLLVTLF
jgi:hypothetical protein